MSDITLPDVTDNPTDKPRGRRGHILTAELSADECAVVMIYKQGGGTIKAFIKSLIRFCAQEQLVKPGKAKSVALVDLLPLLNTESKEHMVSLGYTLPSGTTKTK